MKRSHGIRFYLQLFLCMVKIGAFTFGGGYAMISIIENEFVTKKKWIEKEDFLNMVAIAESTPGPIAINSATYIGYKNAGFFGALTATLGMILPSFTIIFLISLFFDAFISIEYVGYAFKGVQVAVIYLIANAAVKLIGGMKKNAFNIIISISVFSAMILTSLFAVKFSSILYIAICGVIGIASYLISALKEKESENDIS